VRRPKTGEDLGNYLEGVIQLYKLHGSVTGWPFILSPPSLSLRLRQNNRPYGYRGLKIFTSLKLRFQDFQRKQRQLDI
jgi:hypothetical protein